MYASGYKNSMEWCGVVRYGVARKHTTRHVQCHSIVDTKGAAQIYSNLDRYVYSEFWKCQSKWSTALMDSIMSSNWTQEKKHFFWKCFVWFQNYKNNKNVLAFNKNICFVVILVPAEFFTPECIKTNKWCDCNVLYEHWIRQNVSCHHVLFGKKIESPLTSNRARLWFFFKKPKRTMINETHSSTI